MLHNPSEINEENLNNARQEASRHFMNNKKGEYLKDKINELTTNNKDKDIRDLYRRVYEFHGGLATDKSLSEG
jgi:hypothetical protein